MFIRFKSNRDKLDDPIDTQINAWIENHDTVFVEEVHYTVTPDGVEYALLQYDDEDEESEENSDFDW